MYMRKARISMILGILFGLCLFPVAYVSLVIGVALAIASASWFGYSFYSVSCNSLDSLLILILVFS